MTKVKLPASRTKTKQEKQRDRRDKALESNHLDLVKEKEGRNQLFLDEGGTSSESDAGEFFGSDKKKVPDSSDAGFGDDSDNDDDGADLNIPEDEEEDSEADGDDVDCNKIPSDIEISEDDDDDEAPEELSSKRKHAQQPLEESDEDGKESVAVKKPKAKKRKRKMMAHTSSEEDEGVIDVNTGESQLKVVVLAKAGPSKFLNPQVNFRDELLRLSTESSRVKNTTNFTHVDKWRKAH